jgi:opacity protein-like surface antigen
MDENVMTQQLLPIKNKRAAFFLTLSLLSISMGASAFSAPTWWKEKTWRPVMTLGAGASFSSQVGKTQYFPIQNPATDQFYSYVANRRSQTSFLFDGFLGAEWAVTKSNWLFQAGLEYKQASPFNARGVLTQGSASSLQNSYGYRYNVFSRQLLIEGKALYTIKNRFHPYALIGVGMAFNRAYGYGTNVPASTYTPIYTDNTTHSLSGAVGFGIDIDITQHVRAGLGYRFSDLGQRVNLGRAVLNPSGGKGAVSQAHLYTNELLAQFTWVI